MSSWGNEAQYFFELTNDKVLDVVQKAGFNVTGWCLPYYCFENRVYEIGIEIPDEEIKSASDEFIIAKFYRPGRWSKEQIQEEHDFLFELQDNDINVVAPLKLNSDGESVGMVPDVNIYFALFPKQGGRNADEFNDEQYIRIGRLMGRIHSVGKAKPFKHRLNLGVENYILGHLDYLDKHSLVGASFKDQYFSLVRETAAKIDNALKGQFTQRCHGDFHFGNILTRNEEYYFVDFDDSVMAPPVQDIWLIAGGRDEESKKQRSLIIEGYEDFASFDWQSLNLIEPLRAMRMINYTGWLAHRIDDPVFQKHFTEFGSDAYWQEQINDLLGFSTQF